MEFQCANRPRKIGVRQPDLIITDKLNKGCQIKDKAILENGWVKNKMWGVKTKVVPVVLAALGLIPLKLNDNLVTIEVGILSELI